MSKISSLFFLVFFLFSCASETKNTADNSAERKIDTFDHSLIEPSTTALAVTPVPLPPGFILDTLSVSDTAKHLYAFFHFPVSDDENLNAIILKLMKENTKGYEDYHPGDFETTSIEAWVSSFWITNNLVSMCFTDQSYSTGAAHYNHGYTCLNYDNEKHKQVFLTDVFNLSTEKEKQAFCDSILSPDIYSDLRIEPGDLKKETDFMFDNRNLYFFFDDYEKGPSMTKYTVSLSKVKSFKTKEYGMLMP